MCTAITLNKNHFYVGRTLDFDQSFGEKVVITPRNYVFNFRHEGVISNHYAIIGAAVVSEGYPLYFDGVNEKGLCVAGLNFKGNAVYSDFPGGRFNVAQFEFIPWILSLFQNVEEVRKHIGEVCLLTEPFSDKMTSAELHWLIAARDGCITVEYTHDGLKIYDNEIGVLTNNPPFEYQLQNLNNYMALSAMRPLNTFGKGVKLKEYCRGMGALGLPGDLSSQSRFIRAAFVRNNSLCEEDNVSCVNQFFHILNSVDNQRGCCLGEDGSSEITHYSCCADADECKYYFTTYDNHRIACVSLSAAKPEGDTLIYYNMYEAEDIKNINF